MLRREYIRQSYLYFYAERLIQSNSWPQTPRQASLPLSQAGPSEFSIKYDVIESVKRPLAIFFIQSDQMENDIVNQKGAVSIVKRLVSLFI